jgi:hypothetical protein
MGGTDRDYEGRAGGVEKCELRKNEATNEVAVLKAGNFLEGGR